MLYAHPATFIIVYCEHFQNRQNLAENCKPCKANEKHPDGHKGLKEFSQDVLNSFFLYHQNVLSSFHQSSSRGFVQSYCCDVLECCKIHKYLYIFYISKKTGCYEPNNCVSCFLAEEW